MIGLSTSILILASALKKVASLEWDELAVGLTGVFGLTAIIVAAATALSKIEGRVMKGAMSIVIFSSAIKILASACKDLSALSWNELVKGLVGVGVLLAELDIFLNTAKFGGKAFGTATGIVALAGAIKILASAAKDFAAMKWSEIGKGLAAIGGLLTEIVVFTKLTANAKNVKSTGFALIEIAAAMKIFASAVESFSGLSWEELGRGLTGAAGALTAVTVAVKLMPKNVAGIGSGLVIVGAALNIVAAALTKLGKNSWSETAKGLTSLGGSVAILAAGLKAMKGTLSAAAALTIAATALALLTPELKILGGMSLKQIGTGLVALAGAFTVLGIAAKLLSPLVGTMIKVSAAIALFGTGCALAGAGILAVSIALTTLAASLVLTASSLGETIVAVCDSITNSADAIQAAFIALIKAGCNSITETVPVVARALLTVLVESLSSLKTYLPQIVDLLMDVAVDLLDRLSLRVPELVQSFVKMLGAFMESLDEALGNGGWEKLLHSVTAISAVFLALAAAAKLISSIPVSGAAKGIAGFGIIVAGMVGVLAVLGGLAQIPGLSWLIGEGIIIFGQLGLAIGAFVGSLINGLVSNMPKNLSEVLTACASIEAIALAISPMSELLGNIDISGSAKGIAGVAILIGGIAAILTALGGLSQIPGFNEVTGDGANVLLSIGNAIGGFVGGIVESLTGAVTSSLEQVVSAVVSVGTVIGAVAVVAKVVGKLKVNPAAVAEGFAGVAVAVGCIEVILAALGGLAQIPSFEWIIDEGGRMLSQLGSILGEFVGSIISGIGVGLTSGLPAMGQNLSDFMTAVRPFIDGAKDIDDAVMRGILSLSAAILCITAADLISGITSFLTGGSSIAKFGAEIAEFGPYLKQFSDSVSGINNDNVVAAANAAKALAEMANTIPNEGGLASWFAGENNVAKFGSDIASFGISLKEFSDNVSGINPENVVAAANAAKTLAEFASAVPNEGGMASWFAGENNVAKFGTDIVSFGVSLNEFSDNVSGITPENVIAAANAAKTLAEMANTIPNEGGMASWFAGENNVAKFGTDIASFGISLNEFSNNVSGISPENVIAAANAAKTLAEMANTIPNEGGMASWFAGENNVAKFGTDIASFGVDLKAFANNVTGIDPESVVAAANAAKTLAEMTSAIPNDGGIAGWFAGENNVAKFGTDIASFGVDLKAFADNVAGIVPENVVAAASAGKALAEMAATVPNEGGVKAWFVGNNSLAKFGDEIAGFGTGIKSLSNNVKGLDIPAVSAAVSAGKTLVDLTNSVPNEGGIAAWFAGEKSLAKFGDQIAGFGTSMKKFSDNVGGLNAANVTAAASAGKTLAEMMNVVPQTVDPTNFANALPSIAAAVVNFTGSVTGSDTTGAVSQVRTVLSLLTTVQDTINTIDVYAINTAATACSTLASTINSMTGTVSITGYTAAIMEVADKFSGFVSVITALDIQNADKQVRVIIALIKDVSALNTNGVTALGEALNTAGANGVAEFVKAFEEGAVKTETAVDRFLKESVKIIDRAKPDFQKAGRNAAEGFAKGIEESAERAKKAAEKMAEEALNSVNSTLDINSPSKAFYKSGDFSGEGFVLALEEYGKRAYNAGEEMADNAKQGLSGAISKIMDMLNGELDDAPAIRPVLDLTEVERGAKGIDALLSRSQAVTLGENIEKKRAAATKSETPKTAQGDTIYNFNQTLNSPQELDALTINRQTKNMFARFATR